MNRKKIGEKEGQNNLSTSSIQVLLFIELWI